MSHILIQNAGELPLWGIRLLGLSNKNPDQIGQFGTGLKESIALLARMENLPTIFSGKTRVELSIKEIDEHPEICFKLNERRGRFDAGEWHGLGMHPNFGQADWDDAWMVFREILCNAIDESGVDMLHHDIVSDEPHGVEGATRIYIPTTNDLLAAYATVPEKLLPLSDHTVLHESTLGKVIEKRQRDELQVYHRGVWVQEAQEDPERSLFDYEIAELKLTESRNADWHRVNTRIGQMMAAFPEELAERALTKIIMERKEFYEIKVFFNATGHVAYNGKNGWAPAFKKLFGEKAVVCDNDAFFVDKIEKAGKKPIIVPDNNMREFLRKAGVASPLDILSETEQEFSSVVEPSSEAQEMFDQAWNDMEAQGLTGGKPKPGLKMFHERPDTWDTVKGRYHEGVCYINADIVGSHDEYTTHVEELCHHVSGQGDRSPKFKEFLVKSLARVLAEKEAV